MGLLRHEKIVFFDGAKVMGMGEKSVTGVKLRRKTVLQGGTPKPTTKVVGMSRVGLGCALFFFPALFVGGVNKAAHTDKIVSLLFFI